MPYITPDRRIAVDSGVPAQSPGELNFQLTRLAIEYLNEHGTSYQTINDIVGALTCCKDEFSRRVISSYETEKAATNGDVYTAPTKSPPNPCNARFKGNADTVHRCETTGPHETHNAHFYDPNSVSSVIGWWDYLEGAYRA
jgi:hypothetical protein